LDVFGNDARKSGKRELKIFNPSNKSISGSFLWRQSRHVLLPNPDKERGRSGHLIFCRIPASDCLVRDLHQVIKIRNIAELALI